MKLIINPEYLVNRNKELIDKLNEFNSKYTEIQIECTSSIPNLLSDFNVWIIDEGQQIETLVLTFNVTRVYFCSRDEYMEHDNFIDLSIFIRWFHETYYPEYREMCDIEFNEAKESITEMEGDR